MSQAPVILLSQARAKREQAERARRLASGAVDEDVVRNLTKYADELEEIACDLEERACALAETIARTQSLSADARLLVAEAYARLKKMSRKS